MGLLLLFLCAFLLRAKADTSSPCGTNEVLDNCPVIDCPSDYCPTSDGGSSTCPKPDECPPPACKCRFNFRRDENNQCISTRDCPPFDCPGDFQEYNPCPPLCPNGQCSQATKDGKCNAIFGRIGIVLPCRPTCRCIKGYWFKDGVCVPYEDCYINTEPVVPVDEPVTQENVGVSTCTR